MAIAAADSYRAVDFKNAQARHLRGYNTRMAAPMAAAKPANFRARRLGLAVILALGITAAGQLPALIGGAAASNSVVKPGAVHYVSVHAGDTLWSMAQRYAPNSNPNEWIDNVSTMNNLGGVGIHAGERIAIPNN